MVTPPDLIHVDEEEVKRGEPGAEEKDPTSSSVQWKLKEKKSGIKRGAGSADIKMEGPNEKKSHAENQFVTKFPTEKGKGLTQQCEEKNIYVPKTGRIKTPHRYRPGIMGS